MENYTIINATDLNTVDFTTVKTSSAQTSRKSIDESKAVIKFDGDLPPSLQTLTPTPTLYSFEEIQTIMNTDEWQTYNELDDI
tara:strand:- start:858 stop:1106 length:249 start_codon:yes stop_codon:yes gene_type:complete